MPRTIAISLAASSLPYASLCIGSLAENLFGDDPIQPLTDNPRDEEELRRAISGRPRIQVHLSDTLWGCHCWSNTRWKRMQKKAGASPLEMIRREDLRTCLAFQAGGTTKGWLAAPGAAALLEQLACAPGGGPPGDAGVLPFKRFMPGKFRWLRKRAKLLPSLGSYKFTGPRPPS